MRSGSPAVAVAGGAAVAGGDDGVCDFMNPWLRLHSLSSWRLRSLGGLLAGWDRRVSARMQSRRGPPILQPFYDVLKLWQKQNLAVCPSQNYYVLFFLLLVIFTGGVVLRRGGLAAGDFCADHRVDLLCPGRLQGQFALQLHRRGTRADSNDGLRADGAADGHRHVHGHQNFLCPRHRQPRRPAGAGAAGGVSRLCVCAGDQVPQIAL